MKIERQRASRFLLLPLPSLSLSVLLATVFFHCFYFLCPHTPHAKSLTLLWRESDPIVISTVDGVFCSRDVNQTLGMPIEYIVPLLVHIIHIWLGVGKSAWNWHFSFSGSKRAHLVLRDLIEVSLKARVKFSAWDDFSVGSMMAWFQCRRFVYFAGKSFFFSVRTASTSRLIGLLERWVAKNRACKIWLMLEKEWLD